MVAATTSYVFVRDRFTWVAYWMLGYFAYLQAALGPMMPFLRDELDLPEASRFTISNLHFSAFAFGMMTAGMSADRIAARIGRRYTFWGGGAGMAIGAILLTFGRHPALTIGAALVMGYIGSLLLVMIQAALADLHGNLRGIAITESNALAVACAGVAPLLVGGGESIGLTWRFAIYVAVVLWLLYAVWLWREPLPQSAPASKTADISPKQPFPLVYWAYCLVVFLSVSVEWGVISNGADFLNGVIGFSKTDAATLMTAFFAAMLVGRVSGSYLSRRMASARLLMMAIAITLAGFPLFWLPRDGVLNIIGLFLVGLGVANLFPLTLAAAVSVVPWNSNAASARVSMSSGSALLVTPLLVGFVADRAGLFNAYAIVGVLLLLAAVVTVYANRSRRPSVEQA